MHRPRKNKYSFFKFHILLIAVAVSCSAIAKTSNTLPKGEPKSNVNAPVATASKASPSIEIPNKINLSTEDNILLDSVQQQTIKYFWDFAHPTSGLARERSNVAYDYGNEVVTTGGSGMGFMALCVGVSRGWLDRDAVVARMLKTVKFLSRADHYHGIFPHWLNGETGKTIPFSRKDDGGDIVESAYLFQGLLFVRAFFDQNTPQETELRNRITWMWMDCEWDWYTQNQNTLYWHWSPNHGWSMNHKIRGWNECLIAYVLAASHPKNSIKPSVYHKGWTAGDHFKNGKTYEGIKLPLGFEYGGPLFFAHYSFLGLSPIGLKDKYANYWEQNVAHSQINYHYCLRNPLHHKGYGPGIWGLTASDNFQGYAAHSPTEDLGVITPTAALSSMPYTPAESMTALRTFFSIPEMQTIMPMPLRAKPVQSQQSGGQTNANGTDKSPYDFMPPVNPIWGPYGFKDAFCPDKNWVADSYLAIDQGPIVVMIENFRSGMIWDVFMKIPEIQQGLNKLGFQSPYIKN